MLRAALPQTFPYVCPNCEERVNSSHPVHCNTCGIPMKRVPEGREALEAVLRDDGYRYDRRMDVWTKHGTTPVRIQLSRLTGIFQITR